MSKKIRKAIVITCVLSLALAACFFSVVPAEAASASLFLSPASGSYATGASFNVNLMVNSGGGLGINAAEAEISFPKDLLMVNSVNQNGSIFELWTAKPSYSNPSGRISFGGGLTSAYKGSAGKIFSVNFTALKPGTAKLSIAGAVVTAADGQGTNIAGGAGGATYTLTEKAAKPKEDAKKDTKKPETPATTVPTGNLPPAPEVTSPTHPNTDTWYPVNKATLDWKLLASITGTSFVLTDSSSSTPGNTSDGVIQTKTYENLADGTHYFHLKLQNATGWGPISRRKIMVDATPPTKPVLGIENGGDPTDPNVMLKIFAEDKTSGLSKFKITLNNEDKELEPRDLQASPFLIEKLMPGPYTVMVVAYDKADNLATSSITFTVDPLKAPVITDMPRVIKSSDSLTVRGASFYPGGTINLFIGTANGEPIRGEVKTDENGDWNYFHTAKLAEGNYEVWAKIVDPRGAQSLPSTKLILTVAAPEIIATYGLFIIMVLVFIIILLVLYIIIIKKKFYQEKNEILGETREAQKKVNEIFLALHEEVDELIVYADKRPGLSESEKRIKEKIKEALDISEEFLTKEVEDIEKEIALKPKKK